VSDETVTIRSDGILPQLEAMTEHLQDIQERVRTLRDFKGETRERWMRLLDNAQERVNWVEGLFPRDFFASSPEEIRISRTDADNIFGAVEVVYALTNTVLREIGGGEELLEDKVVTA